MFCDFRHKRLLVCTKVSPVLVAASAGQLGSPRFCSCPVWVPLTSPLLLPILPNCALLCFHLQAIFFPQSSLSQTLFPKTTPVFLLLKTILPQIQIKMQKHPSVLHLLVQMALGPLQPWAEHRDLRGQSHGVGAGETQVEVGRRRGLELFPLFLPHFPCLLKV